MSAFWRTVTVIAVPGYSSRYTDWQCTGSPVGNAGRVVPSTGKRAETDYVYVMHFDGDKIRHMTKMLERRLRLKATWMDVTAA